MDLVRDSGGLLRHRVHPADLCESGLRFSRAAHLAEDIRENQILPWLVRLTG